MNGKSWIEIAFLVGFSLLFLISVWVDPFPSYSWNQSRLLMFLSWKSCSITCKAVTASFPFLFPTPPCTYWMMTQSNFFAFQAGNCKSSFFPHSVTKDIKRQTEWKCSNPDFSSIFTVELLHLVSSTYKSGKRRKKQEKQNCCQEGGWIFSFSSISSLAPEEREEKEGTSSLLSRCSK